RPVDRHAVTHGASEQLMDRHAERLAADVEAGIEDRPCRIGVKPASDRAREGIKQSLDAADRPRVLADKNFAHALDGGPDARASVLLEFRPAGKPFVRADLQE